MMLYLFSFHFLDLRFVITRPFEEQPRYDWLKPQWLWAKRDLQQVGQLGVGKPIPGRDRILTAFSQHATVDGGLALQTRREFDERRLIERVEQDGFVIRNREIVADEWGQVRFDLLLEGTIDPARSVGQHIESLLALKMIAPLEDGREMLLVEAGEVIARVYEAQSLKTCGGFRNEKLKVEAVAATAGTVCISAKALQVVLIDLGGELTSKLVHESKLISAYDAPGQGTLAEIRFTDPAPPALCWHLTPVGSLPDGSDAIEAAWSAAFGFAWLIGHLHELAMFRSRVDEYEKGGAGRQILREEVRRAIKLRNNRLGAPRFGGWRPRDVLAVDTLWIARGDATERLKEIQAFADDPRDAAGVTSNIAYYINTWEQRTMNTTNNTFSGTFTGSNLIVDSSLNNVNVSIGALPTDDATKAELIKKIVELHAELQKLSMEKPDRKEQIEAVAATTDELVEKAKPAQPNRTVLQVAIASVKAVAKTLEDVAPSVLDIVKAIAKIITTLHGL